MTLPATKTESLGWSVEKAIQAFFSDGFKDGDMLSHSWLEFNLEMPQPRSLSDVRECQWIALSRVESFKMEMLTKHSICLANVYGEGYRVVPPAEQATYAMIKTVKEVSRALERGSNIINHTRLKDLDTDQIRRHSDAQNKMASMREMVSRKNKKNLLAG